MLMINYQTVCHIRLAMREFIVKLQMQFLPAGLLCFYINNPVEEENDCNSLFFIAIIFY